MRDIHATAEMLAGKREKRGKECKEVIVGKKEIAGVKIRTNHGAKEQNDVKKLGAQGEFR